MIIIEFKSGFGGLSVWIVAWLRCCLLQYNTKGRWGEPIRNVGYAPLNFKMGRSSVYFPECPMSSHVPFFVR